MAILLLINLLLAALACYVLIRLLRLLSRSLLFLLVLLPFILFGASRALWRYGYLDWLHLDQLEARWIAAGSPRNLWQFAAAEGVPLADGVSLVALDLLVAGLVLGLFVIVILRRRRQHPHKGVRGKA